MAYGQLAILPDATPGGKTVDTPYVQPANWTGARPWETTKLNFSRGDDERLDRNDAMRGSRETVADQAYRFKPTVMAGGFLYQPLLKSLLFQLLGLASSSGSGTTGYSHGLAPLADSTMSGPASSIPFKRDTDPWRALIGAKLHEATITIPYQGPGTWDATWVGNYLDEDSVPAAPSPDFTYLGTPEHLLSQARMMLFEAGSSTAAAAVKAFTLKIGPLYEDADFDAGYNVKILSLDSVDTAIQYPAGHVLKGRRDIEGSITYRGLDPTRDLRAALQRTRQFRVDLPGRAIAGSTGPVYELSRFDLANAGLTGTESGEITRGDRPETTLNFKGTSPNSTASLTATILDGVAGPVTVSN